MKKLFTLVMMALVAVGVNAQTRTTVWEGEKAMDSSWPYIPVKVADLGAVKEGDALIITVSKADNSINTGWQWGPQVFVNLDYNNFLAAKNLENGATNVEVKYTLSAEEAAQILAGSELEFQGMNVVITKIESLINEAVEYEETGTTLEMDQYGQVYKDQLADFSSRDKLVFTYKIEGSTDYEEGGATKSVIGWNIGSIKSLGGNVEVSQLSVKGIGEFSVQFTMDELQAAIEDTNTAYNTNGIVFSVWSAKNATGSRVSIVAYKVKGTSTGIDNVQSSKLNVQSYYNLAGQKVDASYKGVVIMNGKKVVIK